MAYDDYKGWKWLTGDRNWQDYGAKWCKKAADGAWWLLRFENCKEWGDGASGYYCQIMRVKLDGIPEKEITSALESCGWELKMTAHGKPQVVCPYNGDVIAEGEAVELCLLDCLAGYGCYSPMGEAESRWPDRARCEAWRQAEEMMGSYAATNQALNRTVNQIGSTASDFGRGDPLAGLRRKAHGVLVGADTELSQVDQLMLKMYGASGGRTLGGEVESTLALAGALLEEKEE